MRTSFTFFLTAATTFSTVFLAGEAEPAALVLNPFQESIVDDKDLGEDNETVLEDRKQDEADAATKKKREEDEAAKPVNEEKKTTTEEIVEDSNKTDESMKESLKVANDLIEE